MVIEIAGGGEEFHVQPAFIDVDHERTQNVQGDNVSRMIEGAAQSLPAAAANVIDHAAVVGVLAVSAGFLRTPRATVDFIGGAEGAGHAIMPVKEIGTLIDMAMPVEHEIHAVIFQHRDKVLPNLNEVTLNVRVVGAVGVGRVVEKDNVPLAGGGREVILHPLEHSGISGVAAGFGIKTDQVNVPEIKRIIFLCA